MLECLLVNKILSKKIDNPHWIIRQCGIMLSFTHVWPFQVDEVKSDEVICTSRNSAQLNGLLTVFHTERSTDSLQNIQNDLPILTEYDKKVSALSRNACLIRNMECLERGSLCPPSQAACRALEEETMNISCGTSILVLEGMCIAFDGRCGSGLAYNSRPCSSSLLCM